MSANVEIKCDLCGATISNASTYIEKEADFEIKLPFGSLVRYQDICSNCAGILCDDTAFMIDTCKQRLNTSSTTVIKVKLKEDEREAA